MKIAIPVEEKNLETKICISFGRTPYFLVYNTENKNSTFLDNSAMNSSGGAGIKAAQTLVDNEINVLLTPRCGENAANVLMAADINIYKTLNTSAKDNINAYLNGELNHLNEIHKGFHGGN